ncbi:CotH kinase family protein [candidate division KSB1 bacterium]|nr:CotH kinase family protein [candidate division KSB1 bacterium]
MKTRLFILFFLLSIAVDGYARIFINEVVSSNQTSLADEDGDYPDWIELYNAGDQDRNLDGFGLSDNGNEPFKWVFPSLSIPGKGFLVVFASDKNRSLSDDPLHTNFKLSALGEELVLTRPTAQTEDSLFVAPLSADISFGRKPDGSDHFFLFESPTPNRSNTSAGFEAQANDVSFSSPGGFYENEIHLELSTLDPKELIHYTIDGSVPTLQSPVYRNPIAVERTTVIRARAVAGNKIDGRVTTHTYLIAEPRILPVISLSTNPENLWSDSSGIYILGPNADMSDYPYWGANFWQDWERPAHIEFYDENLQLGFSLDAGIKIFGSWSRIYPQKSLAVFARGVYGTSQIDYPIFPEKSITTYQSFVMRNAGQDWGRTFFRDALIQSLAEDADVDVQAYRPAFVYFNGERMGIFNLREKMSEHYIESNHGVDTDAIDMIERDTILIHGDFDHFNHFIRFLQNHSLESQANYDSVKSMMDMNSFIDYLIIRCFSATSDWPWNNVKMWRPRSAGGKWRWLLYDTDYGFHGGHLAPETDMFREIFGQNTRTSFILAKLIENREFVFSFLNRYADRMNTILHPQALNQRITAFQTNLSAAMPYHIEKFKYSFNEVWWLGKSIDSMEEWEYNIHIARRFADVRAAFERKNLVDRFNSFAPGVGSLNLTVPERGGRIRVNSILVEIYPWSGFYFVGVPVRLEAVPNPGYRFVKWIGDDIPSTNPAEILINNGRLLSAEFEPAAVQKSPIVINEINYNSSSTFDPEDWVELYNPGDLSIDLSGYEFKDSEDDHSFKIPSGTILNSGGYLVLCRDSTRFTLCFPQVTHFLGELGFGFSGSGELLQFFDASGNLVNSVEYDDRAPWPEEPDGNGSTLALKNPNLDNALPSSWQASLGFGTPGAINDVYTGVDQAQSPIRTLHLSANYPNPFNPTTTIRFELPAAALVKINIYNILGEKVSEAVHQHLDAGIYQCRWDGKNEQGDLVSSGVYLYSFETDGVSRQSKRMLLLR